MSTPAPIETVCGRCESPLESGDLRCAICGQAAPESDDAAPKNVGITILRCKGCGAAISYDPKHRAPACSFCGDVVEEEYVADPMEQTEHFLPFTVSRDEASAALRTWLGSQGWFAPSDLSSSAKLAELKPLWWVAWVFDADAFVSWTADSNAGSRRSSWAPHSGQNRLQFDNILVSASRGLTYAEAAAMSGRFDLSTRQPQPSGADDAAIIEQFDVQRSQARMQVLGAIDQLAAQRVQAQFIPGTNFRNTKVSTLLQRLVTDRYALPAYVLAYRYKDQLYRVVICGQDARVVLGKSPKSPWKILAVVLMVIAILLIILAVISSL
ncbi:MAG: hypothetical protein AAFV88_10475 [Planctomycetota bacterium]